MDLYGQTVAQSRQWEQSLRFCQMASRGAPGDPFGYEAMAGLSVRLGKLGDARAALENGLEVAPDAWALYPALAKVLVDSGRPSEARHWLEVGLVLARRKADDRAADRLRQALDRTPS